MLVIVVYRTAPRLGKRPCMVKRSHVRQSITATKATDRNSIQKGDTMNFFKQIGKCIALPVRILNIPARALENLVDEDTPREDRFISKPLDVFADAIEDAFDEKEKP